MISDKVVAISELRNNATKIINDLSSSGAKYIFVHNKPKAVLVDIEWFEKVGKYFNKEGIEIVEPDAWEKKACEEFEKKYKENKLEFTDAFEYFDSSKKIKNV